MESYRKVLILGGLLIQIWLEAQVAAKTITLNSRSSSQYNYLPPIITNSSKSANNFFEQTKSYSDEPVTSTDHFDVYPELKLHKFSTAPSTMPLFSSYAPPPSGLVSHKNLQLPLVNSEQIPLLLPKSIKSNDYTEHPGFDVSSLSNSDNELKNTEPMLFTEDPTAVILQPQFSKIIDSANILASSFLDDKLASKFTSAESEIKSQKNLADVLLLKTQNQALIIPSHLKQEKTNPSATEQLLAINNRFQKPSFINQFIFVLRPEKISFLYKLD